MGKTRSENLAGLKFGRLSVIEYMGPNKFRAATWLCRCDCGTDTVVTAGQLKSGGTRSCGCLQREKARETVLAYYKSDRYKPPSRYKHGMAKTPLYNAWLRMRGRCNNPKFEHYDRYGGRGIKVCAEWNEHFEPFMEWALANGFEEGLEIDRIDNNGDYCPENCRWATRTEQMRNRSNTIFVTHNGVTKALVQWCEELGVNYKLAHARHKKGLSFEHIFHIEKIKENERKMQHDKTDL